MVGMKIARLSANKVAASWKWSETEVPGPIVDDYFTAILTVVVNTGNDAIVIFHVKR